MLDRHLTLDLQEIAIILPKINTSKLSGYDYQFSLADIHVRAIIFFSETKYSLLLIKSRGHRAYASIKLEVQAYDEIHIYIRS